MAKKKAFALRLNEETLKSIEKWASDEFRSTNAQIEWILMQSLKNAKRTPKNKPVNNLGIENSVFITNAMLLI